MQKQRIQKYYNTVVVEDLLIIYNYDNIMQLPSLTHATLNTTSKKYLLDKKIAIYSFAACFLLTGQKSILTRAHKSIAAFNLRAGTLIGCKITLRRGAMYNLMNKLVTFVLPQIRSFQSLPGPGFLEPLPGRALTGTPFQYARPGRGASTHNEDDFLCGARKALIHIGVKSFLLLPEIETFFSLFGPANEFAGSDTIQGFDITWHFSIPKVGGTPRLCTYSCTAPLAQKVLVNREEDQRCLASLSASTQKKLKNINRLALSLKQTQPERAFSPGAISSLLVTAFQYQR